MVQKPPVSGASNKPQLPRIIESSELFGDGRRIQIQHENRLYLLTITRQNKLILTR